MTTSAPAGNAGNAAVIARIRALPPQQQRALITLLRGQGVDLSGLGEITAEPRPDRVPLSFAQQRLWFLAELEGTSAHYNIPMAIRLRGALDRDAMIRAVAGVVDRHESLRSRFVAENGVPHLVIDDSGAFAVTEEELADPGMLASICRDEAVAPFALDREPPIRVRLLREADDDHVLLVTMHHSASDGWSLGVFFREIIALYEGSPLPPLPIQYADFALWQRRWLVDDVLDRQVGYWSERLAGVNAQLTLPPDRPRPAVRGYTGTREPLHCPAELLTRLREVAEQQDVTLYMVLLSAFAVLLHRYTGETDIPVGSPVAGRTKLELEDLIGFFVNTLVMRTDLTGDPSFTDLLGRVKEVALGAYDHQDVPFEALVEALQLERSLSHAPLFQVMFVLQERQTEREGRLGELTATMVDADYDVTKFDLTLDVRETPDGLAGSVEYNTALYDRSTIQLFANRYRALLAAIADDPAAPISTLDVLDDDERAQLAAWNDTARPFSADRCLHELFEDVAAEHPERTAVVFGDRRWTYAELDARANRIAHALRRAGVTTDSVVGLCMRRAPEMVSGILGIQKAGAAYLPVEPSYPAARIEQLIDGSGAGVVLTQPGIDVPGSAAVLVVDEEGGVDGADDLPSDPPNLDDLTSDCLAYVIYTSGSTGRPKGVMIEHRAAVNRVEWMQDEYGLTADDVVVQKTPFSFDVSVWEFFWPLLAGARLVVAAPEGHKDPEYLISLIQDEGVTTAHFVPSMLRQVVADPGWARCVSLRRVVCSGEALPPALCAEHYARNPAPLHNLYGPTEAAVDVTHWPCPVEPVDVVPIGRPIQNTQLHVLNEALVPQGVGCVGQLHIAGAGLARGYRGNPELTDERFVPNPFGPGDRMYATGDLARWRPDGTLEFLGRVDDQVKLRGFRIEPGEIERVLAAHPVVSSCVVVVRDEQLVAYVVASEGPELRGDLDAHLRAALPEYMVPSAFVTLDAVPVNANGKLDRKALPAPDLDAYGRRDHVAPSTPTERALAEEWRDLLGFADARIGVHDNLFALGGHSLMITVLVARLRERGIDATVRAVFDAPTLGDLAAVLDAAGPAERAYVVPDNRIPPGCAALTPDMLPLVSLTAAELALVTAAVPGGAANIQDVYPLVPSQEGILFHHLMSRDGADPTDPYVIPILLGAPDEDTAERFVEALRSLVARHDVMRTGFVTEGLPEPVQVVLCEAEPPVERIDLAPGADVLELLARPSMMALDKPPLIHLTVAADHASPRRFLLLRAHHLIEDATSLRLILDELMNHIAGRVERIGPAAPYRDFVAHTRHHLSTVDAEAYFTRYLAGITETTAPFGLTEVHGDGSAVREVRRTVPADLADGVRAQARRLRTSPAAVFHAAWALVVAAASGRDDVVFGTVLSGRLQGVPGVERMLGNFINTLPMRVALRGRTVAGLLAEVDAALRDLITHEQTSLTLAQRCAGLGTDTPLFTSMINFRHFERVEDDYAAVAEGLGIEWLGSVDRTNYPMGVSIDDTGEFLSMDAQVDVSVPVEAVLDHLEAAVAGIVAALAADDGEGTLVADIDVLPADERHRLLVDRNATDAPYPAQRCLPDLFEEQARRRPDAIAVEHGDARMTYARANTLANRVAHWLRGQGVGPDTLVGLHADRSLDMVVGLLGILKAGGAYVPLDAAYPQDRVRSLVTSCGAEVVLSRSTLPGAALDGVRVLDLDTGRLRDGTDALDEAAGNDPERPGLTPDHLAYMIFTSGSTGTPKGVLVEHRGVVRLVRNPVYCPTDETTAVLQHSSLSFDVAAQEVLAPLTAGGRLVLHDGDSRDAGQLLDTVERAGVTSMCLSAAFLPAFADSARGRRLPLRLLCVGGEAFSARDVRTLYAAHPELTVVNGYGPTENSIASTCHPVPRDIAEDAVIPIGAPIANSTVYVTDRELRLVPAGAVGELCVGGDGVARGYHGDEELTRSRFVANPFAAGRLYRTGDLVRWLPGGVLEFVGRVDDQLKLRGFRVEPGEVESVLRAHPAVHAASVGAQAAGETRRLVAHVQPTTRWLDAVAAEQNAEQVSGWRDMFEQEYSTDAGEAEDDTNLVGWNSSYTGEPVPADQMREWIDGTVERIAALRPKRLLEVGCGSGLLLFRYAGMCESVHAVDISAAALAGVERGVRGRGWSHVTLAQGDALGVDHLDGQEFDTIVVNSVVQYFPNRQYLDEVLGKLKALLADGGRILLGDLRNADLFTAHLTAVERGTSGSGLTVATLADRVRRRRRQETELLVSPGYFAAMPERTDIMVKRGLGDNEMLSYRYDVVLTKGSDENPEPLPWVVVTGFDDLRALLVDPPHERFGVTGLVNPRVADDVAVAEGLDRWPGHRRIEPTGADRLPAAALEQVYDLEDVLEEAEKLGFQVAATWAQDRLDGLDLVLGLDALPPVLAKDAYTAAEPANTPQIGRISAALGRELRAHLAERVPEHMVPSVFVAVESMPITPNGKVDRRALPAPDDGDVDAESYVAPRTGTERLLCELVEDVLGLARVGVHDTFFGLGGHSLLATRLTIRVRQEIGKPLPLRQVLSDATIAELAVALDAGEAGTEVPLVPAGYTTGPDPLSLQQRELWFRNRIAHLGSGYDNVQLAFRLLGPLDRRAYEDAVRAVLDRHSVLRTGYPANGPTVHDAADFPVTTERVRDDAAVAEFLRAERTRPFDPAGPYPLRVHLLVLHDHEHVVVVTRPWGIFDGWSTGIFFADLDAAYRALASGSAPALPPLPVQYRDFAHWQRSVVDDEEMGRQHEYWRQQLTGLPACTGLRCDYRRPPVKSYQGSTVSFTVPAELAERLRAIGTEHGASLYLTLLTAFAVLLGDYTDDAEVVVGSPVTNRPRPELEGLIGYFVNVLPLRLPTDADRPFTELLDQARQVSSAAHEHMDVPFADVAAALVPEPDPAHPPVCQVMFNLIPASRGADPRDRAAGELTMLPVPASPGTAKFDLNLVVQESPAGLTGLLEYSTDLFARASAERMAGLYQRILLKIGARPSASPARLRADATAGLDG